MALPDLSSSLLEAALSFAARDWPVFPCDPATKRPYLARDRDADGKPINGTGGVAKASTDAETIRQWWDRWPRAMIGLAVGRAGLLVIDFDPRREEVADPDTGELTTAEWTLDQLKADLETQMGAALPATLAVRTPSGGVHLYYLMPEGEPIGNRGNLPRHVDVRGLGGYVIVPPSQAQAGGYRWLRGDADAPIAALPAALETILRETPAGRRSASASAPRPDHDRPQFAVDVDQAHRSYAMKALDGEAAELAATPKGGGRHGGRNQGAYMAAFNLGGYVGAGVLSESLVRNMLLDVVRGFDPAAFEQHAAAIDRGLENGIAKPRDLSHIGNRAAPDKTRGRTGARSASPLPDDDRPAPPSEAYADDRHASVPAPNGAVLSAFQAGTPALASSGMGRGGRIRADRDPEMDRRCARLPLTDLGNAERFRMRHGWRFRFCPELGWFVWDDRRWELLSEEKDKVPGAVSLAVFETVRAIRNEAAEVLESGDRDAPDAGPDAIDYVVRWKGTGDNKTPVMLSEELAAHAKSSEGASRIGCIANLAKAFLDIAIRADAMDADRMAVNVLNGTLRMTREGKRWVDVEGVLKPITQGDRWGLRLHPHDPEDLISKVAHVTFDPTVACPAYDAFLVKVQPDDATRRFLHQWGGLSLTGDISEQKLVFHHGGGRNGKSTLNDLWGTIAGDYGATIAIETFLDQGRGRKGGEATPDLARLPGVRFLRTSEPEKGAKLAEALIKLITGGEPIDARHLNKGFFTFLPSFKLSVQGNHKPKITGHDDGIWRRVLLVPWSVQIAIEEVDAKLPDKLRSEASGVLNRLLIGLLDWRAAGLVPPEEVLAATAKYREQSDQLGRFLNECTVARQGAKSKSSTLFALFSAWSKANGAAEWQPVGFSKAMEDRGFDKKTSNGVQWLDIEMIKQAADFEETEPPADDGRDRFRDDDPGMPDY